MYLFPFSTRIAQPSAHHQENRIVSIHHLVYITLYRWLPGMPVPPKKCVKLVINKNYTEMHGQRNIKKFREVICENGRWMWLIITCNSIFSCKGAGYPSLIARWWI